MLAVRHIILPFAQDLACATDDWLGLSAKQHQNHFYGLPISVCTMTDKKP